MFDNKIREWSYPTRVVFGLDAIARLPELCDSLAMTAPLFVTDRGLRTLPIVQTAVAAVQKAGLRADIFSDVQGNPTSSDVSAGVVAFKAGKHNGVVAFGGGSALDAGKAIAFMAVQEHPIWDFEDIGDNWKRAATDGMTPVIAVPTTAGTGSEVGRASVISHPETHEKKIIFHPAMLPAIALCDPQLTVGLPAHLTAATGFDALVHCLEAFLAPGYHPMADGIALRGLHLVAENLLRAVENGRDMEARAQMMAAAAMGATAFQKGLGGIHAISHAVSAMFDTHHGLTNAVVTPFVLQANRDVIENQMQHVGRTLGLRDCSFGSVFGHLMELRDRAGIPHTLIDLGCDPAHADKIGALAARDPTAAGNPLPLDEAGYAAIYRKACEGAV